MDPLATYRLDDGIGIVTLDDGKANALSLQMLADVNRALDGAASDDVVTVVQGRPGMFSAGFDLTTLAGAGSDAVDMLRGGFELAERLLATQNPVVVACTGHAVAMGSFLLLAADHRIGAAGDFKVMANEVAIGLTMPHAAIALCRARLAPAPLHRSLATAARHSPATAVDAGFLDEITPAEEVPARALEVGRQLAALDRAAFRGTKQRLTEPLLRDLREAIERDQAELREMLG
jgi:enoyl-CoA hydratase